MYAIHRYEVQLQAATGERIFTLESTADVAVWGPNCVPHIVRMVAISLNADTSGAGVVKGDLRPTHGSDTSRTDGTVFSITVPITSAFTAGSAQPVYYHIPTSPITVYPGQEVVVEVTDTVTGATAASVAFWVEALWEHPSNILSASTTTTMTATA